jgi:hypothetical protein
MVTDDTAPGGLSGKNIGADGCRMVHNIKAALVRQNYSLG